MPRVVVHKMRKIIKKIIKFPKICYGPFIITNLQIEIPFPEKNNNLIVCYEDDE